MVTPNSLKLRSLARQTRAFAATMPHERATALHSLARLYDRQAAEWETTPEELMPA
jgi:hypothetical protein